jgi:hypothetical protein
MACTQAELDAAQRVGHAAGRAEGLKLAVEEIAKERNRAQAEVDLSNKEGSKFAAGNRDRAVVRLDTARKIYELVFKLG